MRRPASQAQKGERTRQDREDCGGREDRTHLPSWSSSVARRATCLWTQPPIDRECMVEISPRPYRPRLAVVHGVANAIWAGAQSSATAVVELLELRSFHRLFFGTHWRRCGLPQWCAVRVLPLATATVPILGDFPENGSNMRVQISTLLSGD